MAINDSSKWALFGVFTLVGVISVFLWIKFLPVYRAYNSKWSRLQIINAEYEELRRKRKDLVFHFYWCVDSGNMTEADVHEKDVLDIDKKLDNLRSSYSCIERGGG